MVGGKGVGSMRTPADKGGGWLNIGKILRTSFIILDGPLRRTRYRKYGERG